MVNSTSKPYSEMTPAERLAARIAKNREIDQHAAAAPKAPARKGSASAPKQKAPRTVMDQFQEIKRTQGIDAASEFIRNRKP